MELIVLIVRFANGEGGGWSCQMGEVRVPPQLLVPPHPRGAAEACGVGLRGVGVLDRHLG